MPADTSWMETCCGYRHLYNLNHEDGPEGMLSRIADDNKYKQHRGFGLIWTFSDADIYGNGLKLAEYIRENNLGELHEVGPVKNKSGMSRHTIRAWLWLPDIKRCKKWLAANYVEPKPNDSDWF